MSIKIIIWVSTEVCKTQLLLLDENVTYTKHLLSAPRWCDNAQYNTSFRVS